VVEGGSGTHAAQRVCTRGRCCTVRNCARDGVWNRMGACSQHKKHSMHSRSTDLVFFVGYRAVEAGVPWDRGLGSIASLALQVLQDQVLLARSWDASYQVVRLPRQTRPAASHKKQCTSELLQSRSLAALGRTLKCRTAQILQIRTAAVPCPCHRRYVQTLSLGPVPITQHSPQSAHVLALARLSLSHAMPDGLGVAAWRLGPM
jgi:hypothetical protein